MDKQYEIRYIGTHRARPTTRSYLHHRATERLIAGCQSPVRITRSTQMYIAAEQRQHTRVASAYFRS